MICQIWRLSTLRLNYWTTHTLSKSQLQHLKCTFSPIDRQSYRVASSTKKAKMIMYSYQFMVGEGMRRGLVQQVTRKWFCCDTLRGRQLQAALNTRSWWPLVLASGRLPLSLSIWIKINALQNLFKINKT